MGAVGKLVDEERVLIACLAGRQWGAVDVESESYR